MNTSMFTDFERNVFVLRGYKYQKLPVGHSYITGSLCALSVHRTSFTITVRRTVRAAMSTVDYGTYQPGTAGTPGKKSPF